MELITTDLDGLLVIKPKVYKDDRGYFFESFRLDDLRYYGVTLNFVQDNESKSQKGVLRGLHFQNPPYEQGKLVRVVKGAVLDVAVDIRKKSTTYGKWFSHELTEENKTMVWIPPGFAHGFATLKDNTIFQYKCTNYYHQASEGSIRWNDPKLNINWEIQNPTISEKDAKAPLFNQLKTKF
ncbi:MAG: dTDP-4-dehydrorhamnose 3,5-epimerase [Bacteroidales bacterium]|nr:dTDP-4-dehydrorhamnose 3,5-epimerase [Bacteroidales bacterium]MCF8405318.1 dTDP-4-dehydrorhamnose 3,5-epimerase [Bacteroidales bacterium]